MRYSKAIASIAGGVIGYLVTLGVLPESANTPELVALITTILTSFAVYIAPANRSR